MKFTKEQQDFIKQCGEHFEILTGGREHSKTKQVIEDMQQEIERLNNIINGMEKFFKYVYDNEVKPLNDRKISVWAICLDKLEELKEKNK